MLDLSKIRNYLLPHHDNGHRPHLLRRASIFPLATVMLIIFAIAIGQSVLLKGSNFLAAVLPGVLTDMANDTREIYALGDLKISPTLEYAAKLKAIDMASKGYFAHNSPEGNTPWHWFDLAGYRYIYAGENLASHFSDSREVHDAWVSSPTHRANIINGNFTEIGIATAEGYFEGVPTTFVVQMFGRPLVVASEARTPIVLASESNGDKELDKSIIETPTFVSVANEEVVGDTKYFVIGGEVVEEEQVVPPVSQETLGATQYATINEELISSPGTILSYIYIILSLLVVFVILGAFLRGNKEHHHKNFGAAIFLLLLMVLLGYAYNIFVFSDAVIL